MNSAKCPICKQDSLFEYRPFCSKLCKDQDLLHWINEEYTIPVKQQDEVEDDA
jgi:endogenous inhibitor of DNA gyrase (YacG/DUF329 family)